MLAPNKAVAAAWCVFLLSASVRAATINAASLSRADVNTAVQSAQAGDTVILPAGSATWTEGIIWEPPANVTLKGAGTTATGGGDQTVITDGITGSSALLAIYPPATGVFRLSGITFQSGAGGGDFKDNGTISFNGPWNAQTATIRIDHCRFNVTQAVNYKIILLGNGIRGVMDKCQLDLLGLSGMYVYNGRSASGEIQGNYEWAQPTNFGSSDFFFVEDCIINGSLPASGGLSSRLWDGYTAAKMVVRFNTFYRACISETHATGHASADRGLRAQEAYGNSITTNYDLVLNEPNQAMVDASNGTALVWGNSADQVFKSMFIFKVTRGSNATYPQTATPNGWGYAGTNFNGTGSNWDGGTYNATDTVYGYPALDQPGRGQGDLITGDFPNKVNSTTSTIAWPNQALEPIYLWNNSGSIVAGWGDAYFTADTRVVSNRDYYAQASGIQTNATTPFNGTSGTGWGTLANRPTTATVGVAYWATDQGDWNVSTSNPHGVQQNGADGVLYVATATDTWTLYYEPYTYPHPLRSAEHVFTLSGTLNITGTVNVQ